MNNSYATATNHNVMFVQSACCERMHDCAVFVDDIPHLNCGMYEKEV